MTRRTSFLVIRGWMSPMRPIFTGSGHDPLNPQAVHKPVAAACDVTYVGRRSFTTCQLGLNFRVVFFLHQFVVKSCIRAIACLYKISPKDTDVCMKPRKTFINGLGFKQ